jgi:uncharacterized membrane protein
VDRPANEQLAAALALGFIPLGYFMLLVATHLYRDAQLAALILPALLTVLAWMLCRALAARPFPYALGCLGACVMTALVTSAFADFSMPSFL